MAAQASVSHLGTQQLRFTLNLGQQVVSQEERGGSKLVGHESRWGRCFGFDEKEESGLLGDTANKQEMRAGRPRNVMLSFIQPRSETVGVKISQLPGIFSNRDFKPVARIRLY